MQKLMTIIYNWKNGVLFLPYMKRLLCAAQAEWKKAFCNPLFKKVVAAGLLLLLLVAFATPHLFNYIESRNSIILHDRLLMHLPALNLSACIFLMIWTTVFLFFYRSLTDPGLFISMLVSYSIFTLFRFICLLLVPLDPPEGIVELKDPFISIFYGGHFITKDLFFSGHFGTMVLFMIIYPKKADRLFAVVAGCLVAVCLLLQHVHYCIDIIAAPLFALASVSVAQKIFGKLGLLKFSRLQPG